MIRYEDIRALLDPTTGDEIATVGRVKPPAKHLLAAGALVVVALLIVSAWTNGLFVHT